MCYAVCNYVCMLMFCILFFGQCSFKKKPFDDKICCEKILNVVRWSYAFKKSIYNKAKLKILLNK